MLWPRATGGKQKSALSKHQALHLKHKKLPECQSLLQACRPANGTPKRTKGATTWTAQVEYEPLFPDGIPEDREGVFWFFFVFRRRSSEAAKVSSVRSYVTSVAHGRNHMVSGIPLAKRGDTVFFFPYYRENCMVSATPSD